MITTRVLGLVHELCLKRIHVTKRDLFYTDVKLFEVGHVPIFKRPLLLSDLCKQGSEVLGLARGSFSSPTHLNDPGTGEECQSFCCPMDRTKATRTQCWTTWPACWDARAPACMVSIMATPGKPCKWYSTL